MIRTIKGLYQILTGHYVQVALAWVGIFYLLITLGHWLRNWHVRSETDERKNQEIYIDQLSCLGLICGRNRLAVFVSVGSDGVRDNPRKEWVELWPRVSRTLSIGSDDYIIQKTQRPLRDSATQNSPDYHPMKIIDIRICVTIMHSFLRARRAMTLVSVLGHFRLPQHFAPINIRGRRAPLTFPFPIRRTHECKDCPEICL
jgi:hypothetical protein